jgi:hypothetical protein
MLTIQVIRWVRQPCRALRVVIWVHRDTCTPSRRSSLRLQIEAGLRNRPIMIAAFYNCYYFEPERCLTDEFQLLHVSTLTRKRTATCWVDGMDSG